MCMSLYPNFLCIKVQCCIISALFCLMSNFQSTGLFVSHMCLVMFDVVFVAQRQHTPSFNEFSTLFFKPLSEFVSPTTNLRTLKSHKRAQEMTYFLPLHFHLQLFPILKPLF